MAITGHRRDGQGDGARSPETLKVENPATGQPIAEVPSLDRDPTVELVRRARAAQPAWIVERPGALDVHKASVTACVRVWVERELVEHVAEFQTTVRSLLALRDWLEALGVRQVAMEATGVYWRAPWAILEDRFELILTNARHVKQWAPRSLGECVRRPPRTLRRRGRAGGSDASRARRGAGGRHARVAR
jgi:Transposase